MIKIYLAAVLAILAGLAVAFFGLLGAASASVTLASVTTQRTFLTGMGACVVASALVLALRYMGAGELTWRLPLGILAVLVVTLGVSHHDMSLFIRALAPRNAPKEVAPNLSKRIDDSNRSILNQDLSHQILERSNFNGSTLENVNFDNADLNESDFRNAVLRNVSFADAGLCAVDVRGADLRRVTGLETADLRFLLYDDATRFPRNFGRPIGPSAVEGPVLAIRGTSLVYSCTPGKTFKLAPDGSRK